MNFIGIDNGVSGSIGIITENNDIFLFHTPVFTTFSYTKKSQKCRRINVSDMKSLLFRFCQRKTMCFLERPMVNPARFKASASALRAYEATLIVLDMLMIPYEHVDSKQWQKKLLPSGISGSDELKKASLCIGKRLFPSIDFEGEKFEDADGLLIAEFCRRQNINSKD